MLMYEAVRTYLGVPWLEEGRTRRGLNCFGLVILSAKDAGFDLDPNCEYGRKTPPHLLASRLMRSAELIKAKNPLQYALSDLQWGDILVHERLRTVHLGVVTPGKGEIPLQLVYAPYNGRVSEVPISHSGMNFRWVFRLPNQTQAGK